MRRHLRFLAASSLAIAAVVAGDAPAPDAAAPAATAGPEQAILAPLQALRHNDLLAIFKAMTAEQQQQANSEWAASQKKANPEDDAKTDQYLGTLLAPGAIDTLMAAAEPQLKQIDPNQLAFQVQAGAGMVAMMLAGNPDSMPFAESLQSIATDLVAWLPKSGINDPAKLRAALEKAVAAANAFEVKDSATLRALSLDQVLERGGKALGLIKQALGVYGCDLDAFIDSIAVGDLKGEGDHRTASLQFTMFGKPHALPIKLMQKDGRWVGDPETVAPLKQLAGAAGGDQAAGGGADAGPTGAAQPEPQTLQIEPVAH